MSLSSLGDDDLVERARGGSADATEELFRRHWPSAWRRAYSITGRRALADDIAQEAMLRALSRLDDLDDTTRFGAWLGRIATRRAIDVLRAEGRLVPLEGEGDIAAEWVDRVGADGDLQRAVAALSADRRAVVVMRYWLDLTPPEIAAALEVPLGTVHSRLGRALADLRGRLSEVPDA